MTLRTDMSQQYALKAAIEQLLGKQAWLDLKECTSISVWRTYVLKLFNAIRISNEVSIELRDEAWAAEVQQNLDRGKEEAKAAKDIDHLLSVLSSTLLRQVFLQMGSLPDRRTSSKVTLAREYWKLNSYRSVQYVQTPKQIEALFWRDQQRIIGTEKLLVLHHEHVASRSKLPFSKWCHEQA